VSCGVWSTAGRHEPRHRCITDKNKMCGGVAPTPRKLLIDVRHMWYNVDNAQVLGCWYICIGRQRADVALEPVLHRYESPRPGSGLHRCCEVYSGRTSPWDGFGRVSRATECHIPAVQRCQDAHVTLTSLWLYSAISSRWIANRLPLPYHFVELRQHISTVHNHCSTRPCPSHLQRESNYSQSSTRNGYHRAGVCRMLDIYKYTSRLALSS
jgi:hypothetical protein